MCGELFKLNQQHSNTQNYDACSFASIRQVYSIFCGGGFT